MSLRKVKASASRKETMIQAGEAYLSKVPVEVEVMIGGTWAEASVVKCDRCQFDLPRFTPRVSDLIAHVAGSGEFTC